jgi:hypothetical protein
VSAVPEKELDQGRLWWPPGLPAQEVVHVTFNLALKDKPQQLTCEDYDTKEPFDVETEFHQQGFGAWTRWTGATLRFKRPEQRARPFRWRIFA